MIAKLNGKLIQPKATFKCPKEEFSFSAFRDWGNTLLEVTNIYSPEWTTSYSPEIEMTNNIGTAMAVDTTTSSVGENERWASTDFALGLGNSNIWEHSYATIT